METPESRTYKAELFIILKKNKGQDLDSSVNEIDDVKFANKLKVLTSQVEETKEDEKQSDGENNSVNSISAKTFESADSSCTNDSSKKASINSFNEYQEEPDFEILVKSPELLESYSKQLESDKTSSPLNKNFPGIKKCLVDFIQETNKNREESFTIEKKDEISFGFNDSFKQSTIKEIESLLFEYESEEDDKSIGIEEKEILTQSRVEEKIEDGQVKMEEFDEGKPKERERESEFEEVQFGDNEQKRQEQKKLEQKEEGEQIIGQVKKQVKEQIKEQGKVQIKEQGKDQIKEHGKIQIKEQGKEQIKEQVKEQEKEQVKKQIKEQGKEQIKEQEKEQEKEQAEKRRKEQRKLSDELKIKERRNECKKEIKVEIEVKNVYVKKNEVKKNEVKKDEVKKDELKNDEAGKKKEKDFGNKGTKTEEKRETKPKERMEIKAEDKQEETEEIQETKVQTNKPEEPKNKLIDIHKTISKSEQPIYDEPFVGNLHKNPKTKLDVEYVQSALSNLKNNRLSKHPKRYNSLKSIDEGVEIIDTNFEDICYHGHKNGCTVAVQRPQDVSQEVFKDNWMQRLESLRQKEALLKDKEIALQSRERLLFKKEKELRILERMVKDKMKQAELYLKRCKNSQSLENVFDEKYVDSKSSDGSAGSKAALVLNVANTAKRVPFVGDSLWLQAPELKYDLTKENLRSLPPSRCSYSTIPSDAKYGSKISAYSSFRCRPKPKMSYDDMDSTLSADVGDSSLIVTSRKFDPVVFKKPAAFSRSASERRPKMESKNTIAKDQFESADFEENKIFKKVSENIFASQDKETKFLNYGIIGTKVKTLDRNVTRSEEEVKKCGYLNLETDNKEKKKSCKGLKNRPVSWSAETDDWLQKKREAFNTANKKCVNNCDKENHDLKVNTDSHSTLKKKSWKGKKFSIFR